MYRYIYVYANINTCIHIHVHMSLLYASTCICVCTCVHMYAAILEQIEYDLRMNQEDVPYITRSLSTSGWLYMDHIHTYMLGTLPGFFNGPPLRLREPAGEAPGGAGHPGLAGVARAQAASTSCIVKEGYAYMYLYILCMYISVYIYIVV